MKKSVSILITAYNVQDYIEECLDSIENQIYFKNNNNYEILIGIDNCEKTLKKLEEIHSKYRNLYVFMMNSNKGTYITTNTLIDLAKYNNLIRFDSDDIMKPNMVERIMKDSKSYDLIRFMADNFLVINEKKVFNQVKVKFAKLPHGIAYFKKRVFDIYGGYMPWPISADSELLNRINNNNLKVGYISEILFSRRCRSNSLTQNRNTGFYSKERKKYSDWIKENKDNPNLKYIEKETNDFTEYFSKSKRRIKVKKPKFKKIEKTLKHCHFSILYNEIDFLRLKLPFLYEYFDQIIFYDLHAYGDERNYSLDGSHEFIKNYPDPENKITLIERTNLDGVEPLGMTNIIKQKMFSYGSEFVNNDIDVFWCTDMDEFFKCELIAEVEKVFKETHYQSIKLPYYNFWYNTDFILTFDKNIMWNYGESSIRICRHKPKNRYGHCNIGLNYTPYHFDVNYCIYHFSWISEKRVKEKLLYYREDNLAEAIKQDIYIRDIWSEFSPEKYEKEKDEENLYKYPDMYLTYPSGLTKFPKNIYKELPYLDKNIIYGLEYYGNIKNTIEENFLTLYVLCNDHIGNYLMYYGLLKELSDIYQRIIIIMNDETFNYNNVKKLYRPIKNIKIIKESNFNLNIKNVNNISLKWDNKEISEMYNGKPVFFDQYFHVKLGYPLHIKWNNFNLRRNIRKEKDVFYNKLNLKDEDKFIFLHENKNKNVLIDRKYINSSIKIIINPEDYPDISIFDFLYTIEKASEVHVVNSAFLSLIDLCNIKRHGLFYHRYAGYKDYEQPSLRLRFNIIETKKI